jgi:hypothetical protein
MLTREPKARSRFAVTIYLPTAVDSPGAQATIPVSDSTVARWKISAGRLPRRKPPSAARRMPGCRTANRRLERAPGEALADVVLASDRRRGDGGLLVSVGPLSGLSQHERDRPTDARPPSRRRGNEPHSCAVLQIMPAERAVCRAGAPFSKEHRR